MFRCSECEKEISIDESDFDDNFCIDCRKLNEDDKWELRKQESCLLSQKVMDEAFAICLDFENERKKYQ